MARQRLIDRILRRPAGDEVQLGRTGTVNTQGFLADEEPNYKLRWPENLVLYDLMRRTDPTIRWMLTLVKTPIRAAEWTIEPGGEEEIDLEVAAFVEEALFNQLDRGWDECIREALLFLDFGHMVFERVAELRDVKFNYTTREMQDAQPPPTSAAEPLPGIPPQFLPKPKPVPVVTVKEVTREAFVMKRLAPRMPRTISRWIPSEDDPSELAGIEQILTDGTGIVEIPRDKLVIFTHEKEADDWRGISLLRSAYKSWRFKMELENLEGIAYERSAGLPVVYPPEQAKAGDLDKMEEALKAIRQGESLYMVMPGPKQQVVGDQIQGWVIEDLAIVGDATASPNEAIQRHDQALARNVLGEFMKLGLGNAGARATADVQQDPYYQAVESYVRYIEDVFTEFVVRPLVAWNYSIDRYPRLKATKVQAKNITTIASVIQSLVGAKAINPDERMEEWLRAMIDAPPPVEQPEEEEPLSPELLPLITPPELAENGNGAAPETDLDAPAPQPADERRKVPFPFAQKREEHPAEGYVAFTEIVDFLDEAESQVIDAAQQSLSPGVSEMLGKLDEAVGQKDANAVTWITLDPQPLATALSGLLLKFYSEGKRQVDSEIRRQQLGVKLGPSAEEPKELGAMLSAKAKTAADSIAGQGTRAVRNQGLRRIEVPEASLDFGAPGLDPMAAIRAAARSAARPLVQTAFNAGRRDEMQEQLEPARQ